MTSSIVTKSTFLDEKVQAVLDRLHALADLNDAIAIQQVLKSGLDWYSASSEDKAAMLSEALLPISTDVGKFIYGIARSISAKRIVEFGTSYGISTIYLAAALRDIGGGLVIGSELESNKVARATQNIAEAGLSQFVEIRAGDALQTLRHPGGVVDLLFLDGWKNLCLEVLHLVSGNLRSGSVILADDLSLFPEELASYLEYVRNPVNGFVSVTLPLGDGLEYSVKL
ncbi:methyltransferase [Scytonema sp. UIC 10036]|uniref:O-methyltransferase n=1 Tax=Scytonema sp. UIC 10036 TaxID=2304196 RepID=UPI0012DA0754|nr:class I SAM-dependent methyltransferase [Scytonema sp. UIC 10036]MUG94872.1 methyltransferase [Scytonema sp. UIC 10036]